MRQGPRGIRRALAGAALLAALGAAAGCQDAGAKYSTRYYYTTTDDGITLALRRYEPKNRAANRDPVILCHGLSYNLLFWDLDGKVSLPRYLAEAGYDVWSLSLRGSSPSSQPLQSAVRRMARFNLDPALLTTLKERLRDVTLTDWSVDDHIRHDVPAALALVREQTGHRRAHWIGHSMGAMVMFAYLGTAQNGEDDAVRTFVALAAPMAMFQPLNEPCQFLLDSHVALAVGSAMVGSSSTAAVGAIFGDLGLPKDRLFYNGRNIEGSVLRALFQRAEEEISARQLTQLLNMVRSERFTSLDGSVDYTAGLSRVTRPSYLLAGTVDNMASVGAVQYAFREIRSNPKEFRLFGRVNGQQEDYGHDDLVIGRQARQEVYPTILQWLEGFPNVPGDEPFLLQPGPGAPGAGEPPAPTGGSSLDGG